MRRTRTNYAILTLLTSGIVTILAILRNEVALTFLLIGCYVHIYLAMGRLKDMNQNPWWAIATLLPFVSFILMFPKGTQGANQYGEDPRQKGGKK